MKAGLTLFKSALLAVLMISFTGCEKEELETQSLDARAIITAPGGKKAPAAEKVGNNLSFPVFWAEGVAKESLREAPANAVDGVLLEGEWWFVWGAEPEDQDSPIYSCAPTPTDEFLCVDQTVPGDDVFMAWLQKDARNFWEAFNANATDPVIIDFVDWGDNLESTIWTIQSRVRTELVLYENVNGQRDEVGNYFETVTQYPMRHVSGWGTDEVHGLQTFYDTDEIYVPSEIEDPTFGKQATVYSTLTRMTIQKLDENADLTKLTWTAYNEEDPENSFQWTGEGINSPILNQALHEAEDGPTFFNAEVNVKGKIIYGYTWDLKKLNEGTGFYRITYSFDDTGSLPELKTFLTKGTAGLTPDPNDEGFDEGAITTAEEGTGGIPMLNITHNLTFMDIYIDGRTTGGGGGNSGGGNGGGSNNGGGGGRN